LNLKSINSTILLEIPILLHEVLLDLLKHRHVDLESVLKDILILLYLSYGFFHPDTWRGPVPYIVPNLFLELRETVVAQDPQEADETGF
jgi:hypothetical protein